MQQAALGPGHQHPALPASESDLWLVPAAAGRTARANPAAQTLAAAVKLYDSGEYSTAQATLSRLPPSPALLDYVDYYKGLVQLRLKQFPEARRTLEALAGRKPVGAISLNTALALGETAEASGRLDDAAAIYRRIADDRHLVSDDVLSRLGAVAMSAGDRKTAAAAYLRVYYEFALSDLATAAASHLATLQDADRQDRLPAGSRPGGHAVRSAPLRRSPDGVPGDSEAGQRRRSRARRSARRRV